VSSNPVEVSTKILLFTNTVFPLVVPISWDSRKFTKARFSRMSLHKRATQTSVLDRTSTVRKYITIISPFRSTLLMWDITYPFTRYVFSTSHNILSSTEKSAHDFKINKTAFFGFRSVQLRSPFLWHTGHWVTTAHHSEQCTSLEWLGTVSQKKASTKIKIHIHCSL
jgi:hypothetical protein